MGWGSPSCSCLASPWGQGSRGFPGRGVSGQLPEVSSSHTHTPDTPLTQTSPSPSTCLLILPLCLCIAISGAQQSTRTEFLLSSGCPFYLLEPSEFMKT